jgi:lactate permease
MAVQALPADSALRPADAAERSAMERTVLGWVVGLSAVSAAGVAVALTLTV